MTSTRALRHRAAALALFATFWTMSSGRPCARPTPAQEWIVTPPTLTPDARRSGHGHDRAVVAAAAAASASVAVSVPSPQFE